MTELKVGLLQMQVGLGEPAANRKRAGEMLQEAAAQGCQLVALSEVWTTGYAFKTLQQLAEPPSEPCYGGQSGPTIGWLREIAAKEQIWIFSGSIVEIVGERIYNTSYIIRSDGSIAGKFSKLHLFGLMGEDKYFTPGDTLCLVETPWGKMTTVICYDVRFPELTRKLAELGAVLMVVPAHWPKARVKHWQLLNQARAVENQNFVLAVNSCGLTGRAEIGGNSLIVDPWGEVLAQAGDEEQLVLATLNMDKVEQVRGTIPCWKDRRTDIY